MLQIYLVDTDLFLNNYKYHNINIPQVIIVLLNLEKNFIHKINHWNNRINKTSLAKTIASQMLRTDIF